MFWNILLSFLPINRSWQHDFLSHPAVLFFLSFYKSISNFLYSSWTSQSLFWFLNFCFSQEGCLSTKACSWGRLNSEMVTDRILVSYELDPRKWGKSTHRRYFDAQVNKNIKYSEYSVKYELELLSVSCCLLMFPLSQF